MRRIAAFGPMLLLVMAATAAEQRPAGKISVLLLPFSGLGENSPAWVGQAIGQTLLSELTRMKSVAPVAPTTRPAAVPTLAEARQAAQGAGATLVIFGTYQTSGDDLRITGQVLDGASGELVGAVKATGPMRDLFALEDSIADQLKRMLIARGAPAGAAAPVEPQPAVPEQPAPAQREIDDAAWAERVWGRERYIDDEYYRSRYWLEHPYPYPGFMPYYSYPVYWTRGACVRAWPGIRGYHPGTIDRTRHNPTPRSEGRRGLGAGRRAL